MLLKTIRPVSLLTTKDCNVLKLENKILILKRHKYFTKNKTVHCNLKSII